MKRVVRLTERDLTRIVKRIIKETEMGTEMSDNKSNWKKVFDVLSVYKNPKVIKWNDSEEGPMSSLNWGAHKTGGFTWGFSVVSDGNISFTSKDASDTETFDEITSEKGFDLDDEYGDTLRTIDVDYSDSTIPSKVIEFTKKVLTTLS